MENKKDIKRDVECRNCKRKIHWLEVFPNSLCIDCYSKTEESKKEYSNSLFIKSIKI